MDRITLSENEQMNRLISRINNELRVCVYSTRLLLAYTCLCKCTCVNLYVNARKKYIWIKNNSNANRGKAPARGHKVTWLCIRILTVHSFLIYFYYREGSQPTRWRVLLTRSEVRLGILAGDYREEVKMPTMLLAVSVCVFSSVLGQPEHRWLLCSCTKRKPQQGRQKQRQKDWQK